MEVNLGKETECISLYGSRNSWLSGGLNRSTQHFPEVYSRASENPKFVVGVDLSAELLCSDPTGNSRLGLRFSGRLLQPPP